jgi:hypothetical protein
VTLNYKRISDLAKKMLFQHIKFITSDKMLNDLQSKTTSTSTKGIDLRGGEHVVLG